MIYFYNKFLLFFLPLSLLPILFHLLFEKKSKVVEFTYVNLIQKVISQHFPKKKIIDIIVMILRCLIIMLIILFFAGPVGYFNPSKKNALNIVLAVDTSLSMQQKILNTNKLELCKSYLHKLLVKLKDYNLKVKVITFDESLKVLADNIYDFKDATLLEKISNITGTYKATNLSSLIEYLTSHPQTFDKIIIFTDLAAHILDFQEYDLREILKKNEHTTIKPDLLFCYPEHTETNFYIEDLKFNLSNNKDVLELTPKLNASSATSDKVNIKFFVNDMIVDNRNIDFSYNNKFSCFLETENMLGYFNLPTDSLLADNNFYFTFLPEKAEKKILCFINEPVYIKGIDSKKFYIENLSSTDFSVKILLTTEEYQPIEDTYDGIISINVNKIEDIEKYLNNINIFFINENINVESYESYFNGIEFIEIQENPSGFTFTPTDENEEFKNFFEKFDYKNIKIYRKYLLNVVNKEKWKILLKFYDGTPALLNNKDTYLFSFSIDRKDSNYIYKPLFVSFINYVLKNKTSDIKTKNFYYVSELISLASENVVNISAIKQEDKRTGNYYEISYDGIKFFVPGIYRLETTKKDKIYIAVNINPKESLTTIANKNDLKKKISYFKRFNNINFLDILKKNSEEFILQWCFGKDFSQKILVLLGVLLIFETILSRLIGRNL